MSLNVLVTYATKADSTREVAEFVADVLRESGATVDVQPVNKVKNLSAYQGVVLGSAIRMGKVLGEATSFVKRYRSRLATIPTAYFIVCMTLKDDTAENRATVDGYLAQLQDMHEPVSTAAFAGRMDFSKLGWIMRNMLSRVEDDEMVEGDWRNWEAIRAWAQELVPVLSGQRRSEIK